MAKLLPPSDPPPSLGTQTPVKTLDAESSPTAPIRALVVHSLALSSPIRQIQNLSSKSSAQIQNPDEPSSSSPSGKTLATCRDSQIIQISPEENNTNDEILRIANTAYEANGDSFNPAPRRYVPNFDYQSDDDPKPVDFFSWSSLKNQPTGVGAGLENTGNTCFIASVLQCFTHTVPLLDSLRYFKYQDPCNCRNENFCVLQALRGHIELALRSSGYDLKIDLFRDNLNYFSPDFQINNQEDAHEYLQSFLDKLERCCLDRNRNRPGSVSSQDDNIVDHVFGGRLVSKLSCCNCNSFSETFEPSLGWSLEIEDVEDLSSALESFTCVEKLEDQFTCDDCKEKVSKEKQLKFDKLPLVATFHLKRFKNDGLYMEKIFKDVKFPLELDLLPYMSGNENPEVSTKYHLYAMVEHLGSGIYFGHYSSYVRSAPETWHHFDDAKVRRISEDCVLSKNAYMLFYAREGTPWFSTAFDELKTLFEANPINFSPKSVLETTCREECVNDHTYQNVGNSNKACNGSVGVSIPGGDYSDYRCDEPQDEVFHSAESSSDESFAFESPKADVSEKPFAETFHQEERNLEPAGNRATMADVSEKPFAETFHQEERNLDPPGTRVTIDDASVPVIKIQEQLSSPKRKAADRGNIGEEAYLPKPKIQKPNSFKKRQGTFQIQREHLQIKKKEETRETKPFRSIVAAADPKEKEHAVSYLRSRPSHRAQALAKAMGASVEKKKISNIRRSDLHRNLSGRPSNKNLR